MVTGIAGPVYLHRPGNDRAQISLVRSPFFSPPTTTISYFPTLPLEMSTSLDYLKATGTVVVSDSGDFECKPTSQPDFILLSVLLITNRYRQLSLRSLQPSMPTSPRYANFLSSRGSGLRSDIAIAGRYHQPIAYPRCCRKGRIR